MSYGMSRAACSIHQKVNDLTCTQCLNAGLTGAAGIGKSWRKGLHFLGVLVLVNVALVSPGIYAMEPVYTPWYSDTAIKGYDVVAYFTEGRAVKGEQRFQFRWRDANWLFASAAHLDAFMVDPERFTPQYGGFCAFGVAEGHAIGVDPEQFTVHNGKLYLNFNASVNRKWREHMENYISTADEKWPEMVQQW